MGFLFLSFCSLIWKWFSKQKIILTPAIYSIVTKLPSHNKLQNQPTNKTQYEKQKETSPEPRTEHKKIILCQKLAIYMTEGEREMGKGVPLKKISWLETKHWSEVNQCWGGIFVETWMAPLIHKLRLIPNCKTWNQSRIFSEPGWQQNQSISPVSAKWGMINLLKPVQHISIIQHPSVTWDSVSPAFWACSANNSSEIQLLALFRKIIWLKYNSLRSDKIPSDLKLQKSRKIYTYLQQQN